MFVGLLLVCSIAVSVDDCNSNTAIDMISKPVRSELECPRLADAQVQFADTAGIEIAEGRAYIKTMCMRDKKAS